MRLDQLLGHIQESSSQDDRNLRNSEQSSWAAIANADGSARCSVELKSKSTAPTPQKMEDLRESEDLSMANLGLPWLLHGLLSAQNSTLIPNPLASRFMDPLLNRNCDEPVPVPVGAKETTQGILAVGGCRQCARTFTDRLELIHHFVDHFPAIFYSFEHLKHTSSPGATGTAPQTKSASAPVELQPIPLTPINLTKPELSRFNAKFDLTHLMGAAANASETARNKPKTRIELVKEGANTGGKDADGAVSTFGQCSRANSQGHLRRKTSSKLAPTASQDDNDGDRPLNSFKELMAPMREVQSGFDLPYHMCPNCCLTFSDSHTYQQHLSTHDLHGEKPIRCKHCEMRFSSVYQLAEHERLHCHSCELCGKTFMTVFDLNLHAGTHTGFTYDCKDCGKCFPCRKSLAEHNRSHRLLLGGEQYNQSSQSPPAGGSTSTEASRSMQELNALLTPCVDPAHPMSPSTTSSSDNSSTPGGPSTNYSLISGNPYLSVLFGNSNCGTRKRRCKGSKKSGEKSRRQTTLVAAQALETSNGAAEGVSVTSS